MVIVLSWLHFTACTPSYFQPDEERAGLLLEWGGQQDREGLEALLVRCEESVGFSFGSGAAIKFVSDPNYHCSISSKTRIAGCWIQHFDLIVLEPAAELERTAICHELLHRQLFQRVGDADPSHGRPEWGRLSQALSQANSQRARVKSSSDAED